MFTRLYKLGHLGKPLISGSLPRVKEVCILGYVVRGIYCFLIYPVLASASTVGLKLARILPVLSRFKVETCELIRKGLVFGAVNVSFCFRSVLCEFSRAVKILPSFVCILRRDCFFLREDSCLLDDEFITFYLFGTRLLWFGGSFFVEASL